MAVFVLLSCHRNDGELDAMISISSSRPDAMNRTRKARRLEA